MADREATLRETIETLAPLDRTPGSVGEEQAAEWLAERLRAAGATTTIEPAAAATGYAKIIGSLCAAAAAGGLLALAGQRRLGAALAATAGALIADDVSNGLRPYRRTLIKAEPTQNVVAQVGPDDAARTVVVLAHHDSAPTGQIFDPTFQEKLGETFPGLIERIDTALPLWWPVMAGPLLVSAGALKDRRGLMRAGAALSALSTLTFADIARSPTVPGANDNLSACAVLVAVAEALRDDPAGDVRVLLVSCGAEEVLQGGVHDFLKAWSPRLDRDSTYFLVVDTVGSPRLVMLEGEGPFVMEDYPRKEFRDMVERTAVQHGIGLRRGMRARSSTDAVVPSRHGYPTATLASINKYKALSNYHLMSDTPENIEYRTVDAAAELTEQVIRALGRGAPA